MQKHTAVTLPYAIGNLLKLNNYDVEYGVHRNGAEIDIVATSKTDPFASTIYIEATIEYVSNDKYGKDVTKFILIQNSEPGSTCIIVSSEGFTPSVVERAKNSRVITLTYNDFFRQLEKFSGYIDRVFNDTDLVKLVETYEEPQFSDAKGITYATKWLDAWRTNSTEANKWLIVLGEYGTGKTSLTKVLQYRWLSAYQSDASNPIPIRVELRNFTRQFDARGLMHHFLDTSSLSHISVDFILHLVRTGRVILILDGYDEMAQFLNARERRACLSALAEFASHGAKGLLTSRPNYFTESEELNVFEALYTTIEQSRFHLSQVDRSLIAEEKVIDNLVERYILNRYERVLQDLNPAQTRALVIRSLKGDLHGQEIVLSILDKIFRDEASGGRQSLSGKPVIIAYLLELIDDIRNERATLDISSLNEWQVYKLIVDRLMLRDLRRSTLNPVQRRRSLQKLAVSLSGRDSVVATESTFQVIIEEEFRAELRSMHSDDRRVRKDELFEDLRSSATLTRARNTKDDGWVFSHNSIREYLISEFYLSSLSERYPAPIKVPVTPAMRNFVSSITELEIEYLTTNLSELWPSRQSFSSLGLYLVLLWDAMHKSSDDFMTSLRYITGSRTSGNIQISYTSLKNIDFTFDFAGQSLRLDAEGSDFSECRFDGIDLRGSNFSESALDTVSFRDYDLSGCRFERALLFECDLSGTSVRGADFSKIDEDSNFVVENIGGGRAILSGKAAIGYLSYHGAKTAWIESYFVFRNHSKFSIVEKICERLSEQRNSQLRGLTQRGEARADPPFARQFVDRLANAGYVDIDRNSLVSATPAGRNALTKVISRQTLPDIIASFLSERPD